MSAAPALGTSQAGQGREELETSPAVASLGQGLAAARDLLLPPVWMCLTQTKHNIHYWPWQHYDHGPLDFEASVVRLNKYY